jgi:hypothetical protein
MREMCKLYSHPTFRRLVVVAVNVMANPHGLTVRNGSATAVVSGPRLTLATSSIAFLNWQGFNIASGEMAVFQRPSASSEAWNFTVPATTIQSPDPGT